MTGPEYLAELGRLYSALLHAPFIAFLLVIGLGTVALVGNSERH